MSHMQKAFLTEQLFWLFRSSGEVWALPQLGRGHVFCGRPWLHLAGVFANECMFSGLGNYLEGLQFCAFLLLSKLAGKKPRAGKVVANKDYTK